MKFDVNDVEVIFFNIIFLTKKMMIKIKSKHGLKDIHFMYVYIWPGI